MMIANPVVAMILLAPVLFVIVKFRMIAQMVGIVMVIAIVSKLTGGSSLIIATYAVPTYFIVYTIMRMGQMIVQWVRARRVHVE